jgi:hypothetical protein
VDENLQGKAGGIRRGGELGKFAEGEFTGENGQGDALAPGKGNALGRGEGHLGGGMNLHLRTDFPGQADQAQILNDDGVHLGFCDPAKESFGFGQFGWKDQYVEREVSATSTGMEVTHDKRKIGLSEVLGPETGIECRETKIDGVGPCGHGRLETLPIACGG